MWILNISFNLLILVLLKTIRTQADSTACEIKERHLAALEFAKESISKARELQPACDNDSKDISSKSSECGAKEKVAAYLEIARNLIDDAKKNYSDCDISDCDRKEEFQYEMPMDCSDILEDGESKSGEYMIYPRNRLFDGRPLKVYCDMDTDGGGWTVIQRRGNFLNKIDFFRDWNEYRYGFGSISEEFWIGNDNIFALTNQKDYTVRFDMQNMEGDYRFATYSSFYIGDENSGYFLRFDKYFGTAGDGIYPIKNRQFSTKDKENNKATCGTARKGGWWYNYCGDSNPNGINLPGAKNNKEYMNWLPWTKYDSLLTIEIKIRSEK